MALHKTSVKIVSSKSNLQCDTTCYNFRSIGKKSECAWFEYENLQ